MARSGRQCIVETHSEHIVNRIRLRIADAEDEDILGTARIYFAEREGVATQFTPVTINKYGAIEEWPEGFFDESVVEAERILTSSVRKRSASV
jgi:predicted ATPase